MLFCYMSFKSQKRRIKVLKDGSLEAISYNYWHIFCFWHFLKLTVDYEGKSLNIGGKWEWKEGTKVSKIGKKFRLDIPQQRQYEGGKNYKISIIAWKIFDLKELKVLPPILKMTSTQINNVFKKWFNNNKHILSNKVVRLIKNIKSTEEDSDCFTVQIPKSKSILEISNEIDLLRKSNNLKPTTNQKSLEFYKGVVSKNLFKLFKVFKLKETTNFTNSQIAQILNKNFDTKKFKIDKKTYIKKNTDKSNLRQVQHSYESAKKLLINVSKGVFPKTEL
jgi:hypothetical protein